MTTIDRFECQKCNLPGDRLGLVGSVRAVLCVEHMNAFTLWVCKRPEYLDWRAQALTVEVCKNVANASAAVSADRAALDLELKLFAAVLVWLEDREEAPVKP